MTSINRERSNNFPPFIYGTAWKEDDTERLTLMAIEMGFWGIDTANQRHHYLETEVGKAVTKVLHKGIKQREDLFLQTKFTYANGHDHNSHVES